VDPKYRHQITFQMTPMAPPSLRPIPSTGPIILFGDDRQTLVFSPLDRFFSAVVELKDGALHYGVQGEIAEIPAGFRQRFLWVEGRGIAATVRAWGGRMRAAHGRARTDRYADRGLSHLGYWTDNGGYYYYRTEPGMNEEDTLLAVKADADQRHIPYGYFQLDSWWYFKEQGNGVLPWRGLIRWEPQPQMFPSGLASFQRRLGLPLILHNRWFAVQNDYRDRYSFADDPSSGMSLPLEGAIFDELIGAAKSWGAITYEQDWLAPQWSGITRLRDGIDHSERWLAGFHDAAARQGMTVQLTMAGPPHLMQALLLPEVTSIRTSIDYAPGAPPASFWPQFHTVNLVADALGQLPFKDNFRSGHPVGPQEALISIMSAGMVGPSDQIGQADPVLLARTCRSDGLLLKPDRPAVPLDAMFLPHQRPYSIATYSQRDLGRWTYLSAFHLARGDEDRRAIEDLHAAVSYDGVPLEQMFVYPAAVTDWTVALAADLELDPDARWVVWDWRARSALPVREGKFELSPIPDLDGWAHLVVAPVLSNGLALIGEADKLITLADRRFTGLAVEADTLAVTLSGVPGETIRLLAWDAEADRPLPEQAVTIGASGEERVLIRR
jgi:hypothetical protein